jgi:hypothetical protein
MFAHRLALTFLLREEECAEITKLKLKDKALAVTTPGYVVNSTADLP